MWMGIIHTLRAVENLESILLKTLYSIITVGMYRYDLEIQVRLNNLRGKGQHLEFVVCFFF